MKKIIHPPEAIGKYVYKYKSAMGIVFSTDKSGCIKYYDTIEDAEKKGGNKPGWFICKIKPNTI